MTVIGVLSVPVLWGVAGLVLLAGELVLPGVFLVWVGLAALGVAGLTAIVEPSLQLQILIFSALSAVLCVLGWRFYRTRLERPGAPEAAGVNDTFALMVGRIGVIAEAIVGGQGRARIGDSLWLVEGADLPVGTTVRVVSQDGVLLKVEPIQIA
jgi:membrane protein implicated in regulation of membrane protease activity